MIVQGKVKLKESINIERYHTLTGVFIVVWVSGSDEFSFIIGIPFLFFRVLVIKFDNRYNLFYFNFQIKQYK